MHGWLAGYALAEPVSTGTWSARDPSGAPVWLRVLPGADSAAVRERVTAAAALDDRAVAGVVPVRAVVATGEGVVVVSAAASSGLGPLLAARGRLSLGEVVSLGVGLVRLLHRLHDAGVVHGRVHAGNVLFADDGRPMLADVAVGREGAVAGDDMVGLAGVLREAAGDTGETELLDRLERVQADPATAVTLAEDLAAVIPPAPIRLVPVAGRPPAPAPAPAPPPAPGSDLSAALDGYRHTFAPQPPGKDTEPMPRLPIPRTVRVVAVALALLAGAQYGLRRASAAPQRPAPGWGATVQGLLATRADALRRLDPAGLAGVDAAGSPLFATDVAAAAAGRAALPVVAAVSVREHQWVDGVETAWLVVSVRAGPAVREVSVRIARTVAGWRLVALTPVQSSARSAASTSG